MLGIGQVLLSRTVRVRFKRPDFSFRRGGLQGSTLFSVAARRGYIVEPGVLDFAGAGRLTRRALTKRGAPSDDLCTRALTRPYSRYCRKFARKLAGLAGWPSAGCDGLAHLHPGSGGGISLGHGAIVAFGLPRPVPKMGRDQFGGSLGIMKPQVVRRQCS